MKISSSVEYATRLMVQLARHPGGGELTAEKLSDMENIPHDYVAQILFRLKRAGLVASRRGARGGYTLAKPARSISIGMVVRAAEEQVFEDVCGRYATGASMCRHQGGCGIRPMWAKVSQLVEDFLDRVSLSDLLEQEGQVGIRMAQVKSAYQGKH